MLETTELNKDQKHMDIEIVEIGAISESSGEKFAQYIFPTTPNASAVHGIHLKRLPTGEYDMNSLYVKEKGGLVKVDAVDKKTGLKMFLDWFGMLRAFGVMFRAALKLYLLTLILETRNTSCTLVKERVVR